MAARRAEQAQLPRAGGRRRRSVAAAAHVVGADLRARAAWVLLLGAVVAVVVGLSVAGMVGARRTATVLDRFVDETRTGDVVVAALAPDVARDPAAGEALSSALAGVEGVDEVGVQAGFPVEVGVDDYFMVWSSVDDTALRAIDRPLVLDGRLPAGDDPDEIAVNEQAAEVLGLRAGDTVEGPTLTPEGAAAAFTGESFEGFVGEPLELEVVGVVRQGPDLSGRSTISGIAAVASPAFARVHGETAGSYLTQVHVRTDDPTPALLRRLTATARDEVGPFELRVETVDTLWRRDASETFRTLAGLVAVFTLTLGAAAVIVVAQALNRDRFVAGRHDSVLSGIGMTRRERAMVAAAPGLLALAAGGLFGLGVGMVASAAFPLGRAADAEVAPGVRPDPAVAVAVAVVVVGGLALWLLLAAWRSTRAGAERPARPSVVAERLARAGARPPVAVGVRMAFERGSGRVSLPVRSVVVGTAVAVAAATAVLVVARTADAVAAEPDRYGWVWSTVPDNLSDDPEAAAEQAAGLDGVDSVAGLFFSTVLVDDEQRPAAALEVLAGDLAFGIVEGRLPATETEAALSPSMAGDLDVGVGDRFEAEGAQGGPAQQLTVVGLVVPPPVDDVPRGVVLTPDGLAATAQSEPAVYAAIDYDDRADVASVEASLEELGYRFTPSARPSAPSRVEQLRTVRPVLERLVLLLAALGAVGLLHFLGLSVRRRAHDLAVLKALGFVHGQVRRAVVVQAVAVAFAGVAVGIPVGFVLGRLLWLGSVAALDILDDPASPVLAALAGGAAVVIAAGALALGPGIMASRRRASAVLRSE